MAPIYHILQILINYRPLSPIIPCPDRHTHTFDTSSKTIKFVTRLLQSRKLHKTQLEQPIDTAININGKLNENDTDHEVNLSEKTDQQLFPRKISDRHGTKLSGQ